MILNVAVSMGIRFDKVLEQVARAGNVKGPVSTAERRERKVQRIEESIRAREAVGDRIVMCLGLALTLSAIALPVYALHFSDGYTYLKSAVTDTAIGRAVAANATRSVDLSPATTGSLTKKDVELAGRTGSTAAQSIDRRAQFQRYVVHRATGGSALIEGPEGLWWVTPGMTLPGIGQVISIERSDAGWVVLTTETMITQSPAARVSS
ncbi:hypothetical protein [Microvirga sp. VF16]|uniref:hypothetical protein n=1 Tax=Microvirga sp. VF16 TaxID=2807101 RepID=UPI00193CA140|nr:hypothetical protein [Microvirga sp. VF16]QRM30171.1 hypothetical protein JO965_03900 [Microvirga sp. VF16]